MNELLSISACKPNLNTVITQDNCQRPGCSLTVPIREEIGETCKQPIRSCISFASTSVKLFLVMINIEKTVYKKASNDALTYLSQNIS